MEDIYDDTNEMASKKGNSLTSKDVEIKKIISNGPTSKQAFKKVEEEQRARLAKQRKVEKEWLQRLIQREEDRKKRIQKVNPKEEAKKTTQHTNVNKKSEVEPQITQKLIKNLEAKQQQISAQIKRVKATHRTQTLDRINEETESTTSRNQSILAPHTMRASPRRIYVANSFR